MIWARVMLTGSTLLLRDVTAKYGAFAWMMSALQQKTPQINTPRPFLFFGVCLSYLPSAYNFLFSKLQKSLYLLASPLPIAASPRG